MWGKMIGAFVTLGIVGYMFHAMNASDTAVQKAVNNNPEMKAEKEMLKQAGVDPNDPDAVKKYAEKKAKEIDEYQHSADGLEKEEGADGAKQPAGSPNP